MMTIRKKKYARPSAKVVEWDFNEAVCSVTTNSYGKCLRVEKGSSVSSIQTRRDVTGEWTRVGSR